SKLQTETCAPANQHPPIKETLRTKDIVASSAAALVSDRAYRPTPSHTSTANCKKLTRSNKHLKIKDKFKRKLSTGGTKQWRPPKNARFPGFWPQQDRNHRPTRQCQHLQDL
ncbi:MAG: hypothetical protein ACREEJ_16260, partial [Ensifer adhaerens]